MGFIRCASSAIYLDTELSFGNVLAIECDLKKRADIKGKESPPGQYPLEIFYIAPKDFKIISIFIRHGDYHLSEGIILLNQPGIRDVTFENSWGNYRTVSTHDISATPILSQDMPALAELFNFIENAHVVEFKRIRSFFTLYRNSNDARGFTPYCHYFFVMLYGNKKSPYYDPDKASDHLKNCVDYFPERKAIARVNENREIENPQACALDLQSAIKIIEQKPDNAEAQMFLEHVQTPSSSIQIAEQLKPITKCPIISLNFFNENQEIKKMNQFILPQQDSDLHDGLTSWTITQPDSNTDVTGETNVCC